MLNYIILKIKKYINLVYINIYKSIFKISS